MAAEQNAQRYGRVRRGGGVQHLPHDEAESFANENKGSARCDGGEEKDGSTGGDGDVVCCECRLERPREGEPRME